MQRSAFQSRSLSDQWSKETKTLGMRLKLTVQNSLLILTVIFFPLLAWVGAMAGSLNFLCGPLSSILCDRFGCRRVAFLGALLSFTGLFLTSLVTQLHFMYITYGLLWGVGSSFSFVPSIVMLGEYFDNRLALANGLATSGSGVGSLVASPSINYLLRAVGWKNSLRILSGVTVFLGVACCLYRPYKTTTQRDRNVMTKRCSQLCDVSIWKSRTYVAWVLTIALFQFGYPVPFVHLVSLCGQ